MPAARRKVLHPETVRALAADILRNGLREPITVRPKASAKGARFQLVDGLHRLEALRWMDAATIDALVLAPAASPPSASESAS